MTTQYNFMKALAALVLIGCASVPGQTTGKQKSTTAVATLGNGFVSGSAKVNGTTIHYVRGGAGPAVVLVHGFPQDWYEWRHIMPRLAKKFTVVAVDLRGVGGSTATPDGYDASNLAEDVNQLVRQLKLERVYIAGHDIGGMAAYAFARRFPKATRGVMILDVPLPGLAPWAEVVSDPHLWHIGFHQTPGFPEKMIAGRQAVYFREIFNGGTLNKKAISDDDVAHYAKSYASPEQLRAGMEFYRAFPTSEKFNATQQNTVDVPITLAGGEHSFGKLLPKIAESLRKHGCDNVTVEIITNSGHYVVEEQPEIVARLIERYASFTETQGIENGVR